MATDHAKKGTGRIYTYKTVVFREPLDGGDAIVANSESQQERKLSRRWQFGLRLFLVVALLAPFLALLGWKIHEPIREFHRGRSFAERSWQEKLALVFFTVRKHNYQRNGIWFYYAYDLSTGFKFHPEIHKHIHPQYFVGYKERIRELLDSEAVPPWSARPFLVKEKDLVAILNSKLLSRIEAFPHELTDSIVLFRRGSVTRWGSTATRAAGSSDGLSIATPNTHHGISDKVQPVFVGQLPKYPKVVFIRDGSWVGAFHEDGRFMCSASR